MAETSEGAGNQAGKRFGADLRSMREERGYSIEDVEAQTKLPPGLIRSFEKSGLVDYPMFNRVYLRSFVRSYARFLGVPPAAALKGLEAVLDDSYSEGQIQSEIQRHERPAAEQSAAEEAGTEEKAADREETVAEERAGTEGRATAGAVGAGAAAGAAVEQPEEEAAATRREEQAPEEPAWMGQSPAGASQEQIEEAERRKAKRREALSREQAVRDREARRSRGRRTSSSSAAWIVGLLVLAVLGAGAFFFLRSGGLDGEEEPASVGVADTAQVAEEAGEGEEEMPPDTTAREPSLTLGETMDFTIIAAGGPVQGIRLTRDEDVRRPYWIEQGQAKVFPVRERIVIEEQMPKIRLLAEGYEYPISEQRRAANRLVITRADMQAFADTVRGEPVQLSTQPDTVAMRTPEGEVATQDQASPVQEEPAQAQETPEEETSEEFNGDLTEAEREQLEALEEDNN